MAKIKIEDLEPLEDLTDDELGGVVGGAFTSYTTISRFSAYDAWLPDTKSLSMAAYDAWVPNSMTKSMSAYDAWVPGG